MIEVRPRSLVPDTNCFVDYLADIESIARAHPLYQLMVPIVGKSHNLLLKRTYRNRIPFRSQRSDQRTGGPVQGNQTGHGGGNCGQRYRSRSHHVQANVQRVGVPNGGGGQSLIGRPTFRPAARRKGSRRIQAGSGLYQKEESRPEVSDLPLDSTNEPTLSQLCGKLVS